MILGITATRGLLTERQRAAMRARIADPSVLTVHHGDCEGGDALSHGLACELGKSIVVHPPAIPVFRAFAHLNCEECWFRTVRLEEMGYLERDRDLVDSVDELAAFPATRAPMPRSGTWYTIGYARRIGKKVEIIYP